MYTGRPHDSVARVVPRPEVVRTPSRQDRGDYVPVDADPDSDRAADLAPNPVVLATSRRA
jgi:hypothetical protein